MFKAVYGLFMYKNELYQQTNGVPMQSALGSILANFFTANLETKPTVGKLRPADLNFVTLPLIFYKC